MNGSDETSEVTKDEVASVNSEDLKPRGRQPGFEHLKPMNIDEFIIKTACINIILEHPWVKGIKLVSNPYMYKTLGRANYTTNTVELSERIMKESNSFQKEVFVRAISHFIAKKLFDDTGDGPAYKMIVQRFLKKTKGQSNSTGNVISTAGSETAN